MRAPPRPGESLLGARARGGLRWHPVTSVTLLSRRADDAETTRMPMPENALNGEYTAHLPQGPASGEIE